MVTTRSFGLVGAITYTTTFHKEDTPSTSSSSESILFNPSIFTVTTEKTYAFTDVHGRAATAIILSST
jgi:hypothetical protein